MADPQRRWFFAPSRDGSEWEIVEATQTAAGWELRRPGRLAQETVPEVPPKGADWREAKPPPRPPKLPETSKPKRPVRPARVPKVPTVKAPAAATAAKPAAKPAPPKAVPNLSRALEDLLAEEQLRQPAPEGMVKCPLCGLPLVATRNKKVRTHVNPVKGERCPASGTAVPT